MRILTIIPARGGSKTIPDKNIRRLNGKPLLAYTIEAALKAGVSRDIFVSTDSDKISRIARKFGANVIIRPKGISGDKATTEEALIHALKVLKKEKSFIPDVILTLPPTSPLRGGLTIRKFIASYKKASHKYDAMVSLTETREDLWARNSKGIFRRLFPNAPRRRQERQPLYIENSAIYITNRKSLLKTNSILGTRCTGYVINEFEGADINDPIDLKWVEFILRERLYEIRN